MISDVEIERRIHSSLETLKSKTGYDGGIIIEYCLGKGFLIKVNYGNFIACGFLDYITRRLEGFVHSIKDRK
jgi:hypothetical protein